MNAECETCDKRGEYYCTEECDYWENEPRSSDTLHSVVLHPYQRRVLDNAEVRISSTPPRALLLRLELERTLRELWREIGKMQNAPADLPAVAGMVRRDVGQEAKP